MPKIEHIHPILIHFPIVFLLTALTIDAVVVFARGGNLADRSCLSATGLVSLLLGTAFAVAAAVFGDMALDIAVEKGFKQAPLEEHAGLAGLTIAVFGTLAIVQAIAVWRGFRLDGKPGKIFVSALMLGAVLLLLTAYHGGELVYGIGVNVDRVSP